jgi:hypothetical protein
MLTRNVAVRSRPWLIVVGRYPLDFRGVAEKLGRAAHHIDMLDEEVAEFRKQHPITTFAEFEGGNTFLVKVRVPATPDLRWGVMLGDAIHNLRCALDHAVWQLVQRNVRARFKVAPSAAQERRIQFPISNTREGFNDAPVMRFLTKRQITFLRWRQPYRRPRPDATPLAELVWLSNTDKHRIVHVAHFGLETWDGVRLRIDSNLSAGRLMESRALIGPGDRLDDGTAIARMRFDAPVEVRVTTAQDPHVEVDGEFASEIRFGDGRPIPSSQLSTLHEIILTRMATLNERLG